LPPVAPEYFSHVATGEEHPTIFGLLAGIFRESGARAVLVGGYAVNAYHYSRYTNDIDFVVTAEEFPRISERLVRHGFREALRSDLVARFTGPGAEDRMVDFLFVDPHTMERLLGDAGQTVIGGESCALPSVQHLVAMKLHAIRSDRRRRELVDFPDIVMMLQKNGVDVRDESFRTMCLKFGDADLYDRILQYFSR
jgi:predicted nucleotidyltransferase